MGFGEYFDITQYVAKIITELADDDLRVDSLGVGVAASGTSGDADINNDCSVGNDLTVTNDAQVDSLGVGTAADSTTGNIVAANDIIPSSDQSGNVGTSSKTWSTVRARRGYYELSTESLEYDSFGTVNDWVAKCSKSSGSFVFQNSGGSQVAAIDDSGHLTIKIYSQDAEPDIPANSVALWIDTDGGPAYYLLWDNGSSQVKVALT